MFDRCSLTRRGALTTQGLRALNNDLRVGRIRVEFGLHGQPQLVTALFRVVFRHFAPELKRKESTHTIRNQRNTCRGVAQRVIDCPPLSRHSLEVMSWCRRLGRRHHRRSCAHASSSVPRTLVNLYIHVHTNKRRKDAHGLSFPGSARIGAMPAPIVPIAAWSTR
jgi:hypothetical protein